jgi:DNA-binding transcriptional regulator YhcF (GntR family)
MGGHIKIDRRILEWEWYSDINTCRLFIHLLLKANWKDGRFQGTEVPRGSLVTSYNSLAKQTGLSVQNVRTAIKHLILTGEITSKQQAKFTVITVKNYDKYQLDNRVTNNLLTENQQASNKLLTTIEEGKKVRREESNKYISSAPDDKSPCAGSFLLNDGTSYEITENDVENFQQLYPGIDVRQEIRNITGWCLSNPKNRKTRSGAKRFLNGWLSRSQNSARPEKKTGAKPTGFSNFQQRDYDFDALERELLESQKG